MIIEHIVNLLRKDVPFEWSIECQNSLDEIKHLMKMEPILKFPDPSKSFILETDYSKKGISAVLT